jgi:hypothetical protein
MRVILFIVNGAAERFEAAGVHSGYCGAAKAGMPTVDRHFAAHPEDQDANVVIFHFLRCDEEMG